MKFFLNYWLQSGNQDKSSVSGRPISSVVRKSFVSSPKSLAQVSSQVPSLQMQVKSQVITWNCQVSLKSMGWKVTSRPCYISDSFFWTNNSNQINLLALLKHKLIQYSVILREESIIKSLYKPSTMQKFIDSIFKPVNWVNLQLLKSQLFWFNHLLIKCINDMQTSTYSKVEWPEVLHFKNIKLLNILSQSLEQWGRM